jgi:dihydrofolate reductase
MRTLVVNTFLSLDGVMQAPGGPEEDPTGAFGHGGWSAGYWDDAMGQRMGEVMGKPFDLLLGRKTYEIFAAHWGYITDDPAADALNAATKYVASTTLTSVDWKNSQLLTGDVPTAVARLKEGDGPEIQVHGSANLIQTLQAHDLVDAYNVWTFPVVLGRGKRLFEAGAPAGGLERVDSQAFSTGVVLGTYRPAGAIRAGSFALEQPTDEELARRKKLAAEG